MGQTGGRRAGSHGMSNECQNGFVWTTREDVENLAICSLARAPINENQPGTVGRLDRAIE